MDFGSLLLLKGRSRPCQWAGSCCAKVNGLQRIHQLPSGVDRICPELLTGPKSWIHVPVQFVDLLLHCGLLHRLLCGLLCGCRCDWWYRWVVRR